MQHVIMYCICNPHLWSMWDHKEVVLQICDIPSDDSSWRRTLDVSSLIPLEEDNICFFVEHGNKQFGIVALLHLLDLLILKSLLHPGDLNVLDVISLLVAHSVSEYEYHIWQCLVVLVILQQRHFSEFKQVRFINDLLSDVFMKLHLSEVVGVVGVHAGHKSNDGLLLLDSVMSDVHSDYHYLGLLSRVRCNRLCKLPRVSA